MDLLDILRELDKIEDALLWAAKKESHTAQMNAAQHCNTRVMDTPLFGRLQMAIDSLIGLRNHFRDDIVEPDSGKVITPIGKDLGKNPNDPTVTSWIENKP